MFEIPVWYWVYAGFWSAAVAFLVPCVLQTWEHLRFVRNHLFRCEIFGKHQLPITLCVPCKGMDLELEANLRPLMEQAYSQYDVVFVVESADDPAVAIIERVRAAYPGRASRLIVAGLAPHGGQKVHNLLRATEDLPAETVIVAFVDSDARPHPDWLNWLADYFLPKEDPPRLVRVGAHVPRKPTRKLPPCGAISGYRWFIPERDSVPNWLVYSINASVATLWGPKFHGNLVWGGSWAMPRAVLDRFRIREAWEGKVSDDLTVSQVLTQVGWEARYQPQCMVASPIDLSFFELLEFLRRQYVLVRFHLPHVWALALLASTCSVGSLWIGLGLSLYGLAVGANWTIWPILATVSLYGLGWYRAWIRGKVALDYFPHLHDKLVPVRRFDQWAFPVAGLIGWIGLISSIFGNQIRWRGILYRLHRDGSAEILARRANPSRSTLVPRDDIRRAA